MELSRVLCAVAFLSLGACGEDSTEPEAPPYVPKDHRGNVTGTYLTSGTMTTLVDGMPQRALIPSATLRISSPTSDIKVLNLQLGALNCPGGIEAKMAGARTFQVVRASCPVPTDPPSCTSVLELNDGQGVRDTEKGLGLSLKGTLRVTCGAAPSALPITLELFGTHTGAALPDSAVDSLAEHPDLSTLLQTLSTLSRE